MDRGEENLYLKSTVGEISKLKDLSHKVSSEAKNILGDGEEILSLDSIIRKIKELNPTIEVKKSINGSIIFSSISADDLVLPEGFYYSQINGITNKYVIHSDNYISIRVYPLEYYNPSFI